VQKMRVEMAAMKRDAEHYSRQVTSLIDHTFCLILFILGRLCALFLLEIMCVDKRGANHGFFMCVNLN
jgi:hypothetical protein